MIEGASGEGAGAAGEFRPEAWASVNFSEDGSALITLFRSADLSSVPHELAHVMRRQLEHAASDEQASALIKAHWQAVCDFVGARPGEKWSREMEEKFARAAERYLWEGVAPNARLAGAFEIMKEDLGQIYADADAAGLTISPEMRQIFNDIYSLPVDKADAQFRAAVHELANMELEREFAPSPETEARWRDSYDQANLRDLEEIVRQERERLEDGLVVMEADKNPELEQFLQDAKKTLEQLDLEAEKRNGAAELFPEYAKCLLGV